MGEPWTVDRVEAAAPDAASIKAGRKLATPGPWSEIGFQGGSVVGGLPRIGKDAVSGEH